MLAVDRAALHFGRFLRHNSAARLGCVAYVVTLHVWLLVLITQLAPSPQPHRHAARGGDGGIDGMP